MTSDLTKGTPAFRSTSPGFTAEACVAAEHTALDHGARTTSDTFTMRSTGVALAGTVAAGMQDDQDIEPAGCCVTHTLSGPDINATNHCFSMSDNIFTDVLCSVLGAIEGGSSTLVSADCSDVPGCPRCTKVSGKCTGASIGSSSDQCVTAFGTTQCCHPQWLWGTTPWIESCDGFVTKGCSGPCW
jgi:hypothetical protein